MNRPRRFAALLAGLVFLCAPLGVAHAQGIVTCTGVPNSDGTGSECTFQDLLKSSQKFINYAMVLGTIGIPVGFAFVIIPVLVSSGFEGIKSNVPAYQKMLTDGGEILKWYGLLLISWLVVNLISMVFLNTNLQNIFNFHP